MRLLFLLIIPSVHGAWNPLKAVEKLNPIEAVKDLFTLRTQHKAQVDTTVVLDISGRVQNEVRAFSQDLSNNVGQLREIGAKAGDDAKEVTSMLTQSMSKATDTLQQGISVLDNNCKVLASMVDTNMDKMENMVAATLFQVGELQRTSIQVAASVGRDLTTASGHIHDAGSELSRAITKASADMHGATHRMSDSFDRAVMVANRGVDAVHHVSDTWAAVVVFGCPVLIILLSIFVMRLAGGRIARRGDTSPAMEDIFVDILQLSHALAPLAIILLIMSLFSMFSMDFVGNAKLVQQTALWFSVAVLSPPLLRVILPLLKVFSLRLPLWCWIALVTAILATLLAHRAHTQYQLNFDKQVNDILLQNLHRRVSELVPRLDNAEAQLSWFKEDLIPRFVNAESQLSQFKESHFGGKFFHSMGYDHQVKGCPVEHYQSVHIGNFATPDGSASFGQMRISITGTHRSGTSCGDEVFREYWIVWSDMGARVVRTVNLGRDIVALNLHGFGRNDGVSQASKSGDAISKLPLEIRTVPTNCGCDFRYHYQVTVMGPFELSPTPVLKRFLTSSFA